MERAEVLERLNALADPEGRAGMARFGIATDRALGIRIPELRRLAKEIGRDHRLALRLWDTRIHEARILASMVDDPSQVTDRQMDAWVRDFDSWDVCDQVCGNLFDKTPYAYQKAVAWSGREQEFVKRAGFAMMAYLAVHDKKADDAAFRAFLPPLSARRTTAEITSRRVSTGHCGRLGSGTVASMPSPSPSRGGCTPSIRNLRGGSLRMP